MILVTGATGNNGRELIKRLSTAGVAVRGMVRNPLATDKQTGVEFVAGDFDDPESVRRALDGVERAFLVTNSTKRAEEQQLDFVRVARAAGLRHIVYLSHNFMPQKIRRFASCVTMPPWRKQSRLPV